MTVIAGDINSRIGKIEDCQGIDDIPSRQVLDETKNQHGMAFVEFLREANCCVLNGRFDHTSNAYTSVTTKGNSVVDYFIVPVNDFKCCKCFCVESCTEIITNIGLQKYINTKSKLPDHSLLSMYFSFESSLHIEKDESGSNTKKRFKYDCIPNDFLMDEQGSSYLVKMIDEITLCRENQDNVDKLYDDLVKGLMSEMDRRIPVRPKFSKRKQAKVRHPFWNSQLEGKWQEVCKAERLLRKCNNRLLKRDRRYKYKCAQDNFDKLFRRHKRQYHRQKSLYVEEICTSEPNVFWDYVKRLGPPKKKFIPMEVYNNDGSLNCDNDAVLSHWKSSFSTLFNAGVGVEGDDEFRREVRDFIQLKEQEMDDPLFEDVHSFNNIISETEVSKVMKKLKLKKSVGIDEIPNEVLKCPVILPLLVNLFNLCYDTGIVPQPWYQSIVHPLHKSPETDPRIPTHYRGISLVSCVSKVFTAVLAHRVSDFLEDNDLLEEEQGGFRNGRSCVDQAFVLHSLAKNSISKGRELLGCFIDLRKAFDGLDRMFLMYKLLKVGLSGKLYKVIKSLYDPEKTQSCIRLNNNLTDWFNTGKGVKQGDSLSPILFLTFINDLAKELKSLNIGVNYGNSKIPILMYADDVVLLTENSDELQIMLDCVYNWCKKWQMSVNLDKTKIVSFRKRDQIRMNRVFKYGDNCVDYVSCYKYLGIYFDEHLSFEDHADKISSAGSRALGAIICKLKTGECVSYESYSKCVHSCVFPILEYGTEITGICKMHPLDKIIDKSARAFLGVHKFCPIVSMYKDLDWTTGECRRKLNVLRFWNRLILMPEHRITKMMFNTMHTQPYRSSWCSYVKSVFKKMDMISVYNEKQVCDLQLCKRKLENEDKQLLLQSISKKPKLRLFKQIMCEEGVENYVKLNLTSGERSMIAQIRMGILPIRIETGRFTNMKIKDRICQFCNTGAIEDELHFMFHCSLYDVTRRKLFHTIKNDGVEFSALSDLDKYKMLNTKYARQFAKYIVNIFQERRNSEYKEN